MPKKIPQVRKKKQAKIQEKNAIQKKKNQVQITERKNFVVLSTWEHGHRANQAAINVLRKNGCSTDALVAGCKFTECEKDQRTVGLGGWPDREGVVTLDACIMEDNLNQAGSVAFVRGVQHPIELARLVMKHTPHVLLVGEGAQMFAKEKGIKVSEKPLDSTQKERWEKWLKEKQYKPVINVESHDTISMIVLDQHGRITAGSTTSGLAFKMHGRVGDSPIIGSGVYVEKPIGAAVCTGLGEVVQRTVGAHSIVEAMRYGLTPQQSCDDYIKKLIKLVPNPENYQVGVLALDYSGNLGAASVHPGFNYGHAIAINQNLLKESSSFFKKPLAAKIGPKKTLIKKLRK